MNRATIAIVGASFLMALEVLDIPTAWRAIDYKTLIFLFSMMVISANLTAELVRIRVIINVSVAARRVCAVVPDF